MSQSYRYPASSTISIAAVGVSGSPIPGFSILIGAEDPSGDLQPLQVAVDGSLIISATSLPLPTGASTAARQDTGNASLASIDSKIPSGLTVTATRLLVDGSGVTQPISATTLPLPAGAATLAGQTQPGVDIGDVTVNNAAGAAAVNIQDGGNSLTVDGSVSITGSVAVTGGLTDAELRATPVPVSGTVTANAGAGTFAISAAALPLPAGAATLAGQTQPGVDIGDVTVNNAAGAAAVNIQDGGNSITVDGTVAATQSGTWTVSSGVPAALTVKQAAISVGTTAVRITTDGAAPSATRRVLMANMEIDVTAKFYIGSATVTSTGATRGVLLMPGQTFQTCEDAGDYYIISDTAAQTIYVTEQE